MIFLCDTNNGFVRFDSKNVMEKEYSFERLNVWKRIRPFKKEVYTITQGFPKEELFGLTSQIRRSAVSMSANLAEGSGRISASDRAHFTNLSYSSALETLDHLHTSLDLEYLTEQDFQRLREELSNIIGMLNGLYQYQLKEGNNLKDIL